MQKNKSAKKGDFVHAKKIYLCIDDIRTPATEKEWTIVRSYDEAINFIQNNGVPNFISFDHDLGLNLDGTIAKSGYDVAKWIIEAALDERITIPFNVHSANPVGKKNIESLLQNYFKQKMR